MSYKNAIIGVLIICLILLSAKIVNDGQKKSNRPAVVTALRVDKGGLSSTPEYITPKFIKYTELKVPGFENEVTCMIVEFKGYSPVVIYKSEIHEVSIVKLTD